MTAAGIESEGHLSGPDPAEPDPTQVKQIIGKSPTRLAMERLVRDKLTMFSLVVVVLYFLAAIAAPFLVQSGVLNPEASHQDLLDANTMPMGSWGGISADHPMGVEPGTGRDLLSRIWFGMTFSLGISIAATIVAMVIGVVLGIVSGAAGGWVDWVIGRLTDLTLAFPQTLMLLAFSSVAIAMMTEAFGITDGDEARAAYVILVLGLFGWTSVARLVRGQVLSIREREFVHAATLLGASRFRIYFKEILPNLWAPILVTFTLILPAFISAEAALSFLNVSIRPPTPTLGNIMRVAFSYAETDPPYFLFPAFILVIIVVSFNLLGDGLRDALDPKSER